MAVQNLANHPFHNWFNPTALLHSYSGHSYSEMKLFWGAKGATLLTSDYMATCGRPRDTLVPALLVPKAVRRKPRFVSGYRFSDAVSSSKSDAPFRGLDIENRGKLFRQMRAKRATPKNLATKYNSTGDSVTLSEKSASSYE